MFVDDGFSGVSFVRPFFAEMMQLADTGEARTIIVKDHSRLSRNYLVITATWILPTRSSAS